MPSKVAWSPVMLAEPLRKLTHWSILALFFLTPLVFAPFTSEALEINKQFVAGVLIILATVGWLGNMLLNRSVSLRGGWLINLMPLILLGTGLGSAVLSIAGVESWLGYGGQEYLSFLTMVLGVMLFYVLVNVSNVKFARQALMALLVSSGVIGLLTILSLIGVHLLPFEFTHALGFNTIGNPNALVSWLIPVALAGLGFYLTDDGSGETVPSGPFGLFMRIITGLVLIVTVILLVLIDFWALWVVLMVGLAALMFLSVLEPKQFIASKKLAVPAGLFLLAIFFLFIKTPFTVALPVVVSPNLSSSFSIAKQTISQNPIRFIFGSGNGSFDLDYAKYRPVEINNTLFWNVRFDRAQIHPLTLLATTGVLGLLAWLSWLVTLAAFGLGRIMRGRAESDWKVNYALLAGWLSLLAVQILSPLNMSITILFWGLSGLMIAEALSTKREFAFADAPRAALTVTAGFGAFSVAAILVLLALVSRHGGELAFAKAAKLDALGSSPDELVAQMQLAVKRSPGNAVYQRNLATAYLAKANDIAAEVSADGDLSTQDNQRLLEIATLATSSAAQAGVLGPNDSYNWSTSGLIFRQLMPIIQNAQNYAASMYIEAIALEPFNPSYQTDLGQVYLTVADRARAIQELATSDADTKATAALNETEDLRIAAESFEKAIALKADYAPAHYYLAATFERQGRLDEAASRLAALTTISQNDIGLGFQLGVIYLKLGKQAEAAQEFERILTIYPDYSNAMWYLAAIKAKDDDITGALALLRRVEKLNPESQIVIDSINNLEQGSVSASIPEPIEEAVQADVVTE